MVATARDRCDERSVWDLLATLPDPEIPVVSLVDLGIVTAVSVEASGRVTVHITPTYSGCPATEVIQESVTRALEAAGYPDANVRTVLSPAWTTDWITRAGRDKLRAYGIAPPASSADQELRGRSRIAACPRCGSRETTRLSEFGSTPCKAHYRCDACLEPFDQFKCV